MKISLILREARTKGTVRRILHGSQSPAPLHLIGTALVIQVMPVTAWFQKPSPWEYCVALALVVWGVYVSIEPWSVWRRPDAVIQLLSLGESLAGLARGRAGTLMSGRLPRGRWLTDLFSLAHDCCVKVIAIAMYGVTLSLRHLR